VYLRENSEVRTMNEIDNLTDSEIAYLAGIVDGEGSILMSRDLCPKGDRKLRYRVRLVIAATTSLDLVAWISSRMGVLVSRCNPRSARHSLSYRMILSEIKAEQLMPKLMPYLVIKQRQAKLFMEYRKLQRFCWEHRNARRAEIKSVRFLREWFYQEFRRLNRRGPVTVTTNTPDTVAFEAAMAKIESELHGDVQRAVGDNAPPTIQ
jgi:hypothetical protein